MKPATITFDPPYRSDIDTAINEEGVDNAQASRLVFVHQHHDTFQREILEVLRNHPLDTRQALRSASELTVVIETGEPASTPPSPRIDSDGWPRLVLKLPNEDYVLASLHAILSHELAHVVDRLNPQFALSLRVRVPPRVVTLWNLSIDGRLARHGVRVPHVMEEPIDPAVAKRIACCDRPTYAWLVELAGDVVDNNNTTR